MIVLATRGRSHRLFDLLVEPPELLGLVDPLALVLREGLQVQLTDRQTDRQAGECTLLRQEVTWAGQEMKVL